MWLRRFSLEAAFKFRWASCKDDQKSTFDGSGKKDFSVGICISLGKGNGNPLLPGKSHGRRSLVGCSPWGHTESDTTERLHFHTLEKEMATHSSVLAWRIPGTVEPGGLPSMGSHRVGHGRSGLAAAVGRAQKYCFWRR